MKIEKFITFVIFKEAMGDVTDEACRFKIIAREVCVVMWGVTDDKGGIENMSRSSVVVVLVDVLLF